MRLDKPIGILLLLWPTLCALCVAFEGHYQWNVVIIFVLGVVLMRSVGCIFNDIADRHVDLSVTRTKQRPLVTGQASLTGAVVLGLLLSVVALLLLLYLNNGVLRWCILGFF